MEEETVQSRYASYCPDRHILVSVATEHGFGAFWLHELKQIDQQSAHTRIVLTSEDIPRVIVSPWMTLQVIGAINAAVG